MGAVDDYFASLDEPTRSAFQRVRDLATETVPEAEQGTSYGIAALTYRGSPLLGFRAAKQHLSIVPFSPEAVDAVRDRLGDFDLSKGTIRFGADTALPDDAIRELLGHRKAEIDQRHRPNERRS